MYADRVKKPILLIHGDEDNNAGTMTLQSERFFSALKGHGALTRLVLLPLESHGYQGHESVMHCLWEMDRWLESHCVNAAAAAGPSSSPAGDASEVKPSGGGSAPECAPTGRTFLPLSSSL